MIQIDRLICTVRNHARCQTLKHVRIQRSFLSRLRRNSRVAAEQIWRGKVGDWKRYPLCTEENAMQFFIGQSNEPKNDFIDVRRNRCCSPSQRNISIPTRFNFIQINHLKRERKRRRVVMIENCWLNLHSLRWGMCDVSELSCPFVDHQSDQWRYCRNQKLEWRIHRCHNFVVFVWSTLLTKRHLKEKHNWNREQTYTTMYRLVRICFHRDQFRIHRCHRRTTSLALRLQSNITIRKQLHIEAWKPKQRSTTRSITADP